MVLSAVCFKRTKSSVPAVMNVRVGKRFVFFEDFNNSSSGSVYSNDAVGDYEKNVFRCFGEDSVVQVRFVMETFRTIGSRWQTVIAVSKTYTA